uniref:Uncharacterized protein n=1 Tax=Arundo donax TaxID=35708 RepID=A0A0A9APK9_ARUDO
MAYQRRHILSALFPG